MTLFSHRLCCFGSRCALRLVPQVRLNYSTSCAMRVSGSWRLDLSGNATRRLARTACAASRDMPGFRCQALDAKTAGCGSQDISPSAGTLSPLVTREVMLSPTGCSIFPSERVTGALIRILLAPPWLQHARTHFSCKGDRPWAPSTDCADDRFKSPLWAPGDQEMVVAEDIDPADEDERLPVRGLTSGRCFAILVPRKACDKATSCGQEI